MKFDKLTMIVPRRVRRGGRGGFYKRAASGRRGRRAAGALIWRRYAA